MLACNNMLRVELKNRMGFLCQIRLDFLLCLGLGEGELRQGEVVRLGKGGLRLGEPKGSLAGEVLPRLGEGVLCLGEPETAIRCCFPVVLYIV